MMINIINKALLNINASRKYQDCIINTKELNENSFSKILNKFSMIFISIFARFLSFMRHSNVLDRLYKSSTLQTILLSCHCNRNILNIFRILMKSEERRPDSDSLKLELEECVISAIINVCAARMNVRLTFFYFFKPLNFCIGRNIFTKHQLFHLHQRFNCFSMFMQLTFSAEKYYEHTLLDLLIKQINDHV